MFSLIITVIAIVLVAVLALASIYYGGQAWNQGSDKAAVARYINEAQQISAAVDLFRADNTGAYPDDVGDLEGEYLKTLPEGAWAFSSDRIVRTGLTESQCLSANKMSGFNVVELCSVAPAEHPCCEIDP